ncbi:type IV toxin-antitoxin system AbiEi family antitoxin [Paraburkholderia piptadeniae]
MRHLLTRRPGSCPPVQEYSDLIASGDSCNVETARLIRDRFIAR